MNEAQLKEKAKSKVRIMVRGWMCGNLEMQKTLIVLSDALIRGIIDQETIDSAFRDRLVAHIVCNKVGKEMIMFTSVVWDLIKDVLIEEARALQN